MTVRTWQGEQKPHLVVVSNSADDFALAQGWHVLLGNSHWIPEANLLLERPAHLVAWMLGHDLASDAVYGNKRSFLTSASLPLGQLRQLAQEWYDGHLRSSWDREPTDEDTVESEPGSRLECTPPEQVNLDHGGMLAIQEDYDLPLALPAEENDQGDISLLVDLPPLTPSHSALRNAAGLTWEIDLRFISTATPHSRGLSPRVLQAYSGERVFESLVRRGHHGVTCYSFSHGLVSGGSTQIQALAKPRLRLPGLYSWAQALAEDHEMRMEFSEAGHRVEILRRMWGSRAELASDWAGPLRPIFLAFRKEARMSRDAFPEKDGLVLRPNEAVLSFQAMTRAVGAALDRKGLRSKIDRLCLLGVMRRGLVLDCEACGYLGFIDLDTVSTVNSCARCGAQNPLTLGRWQDPIEEPTWWYDLHGAARELLAEDSGIALLCSAYLRQSARSYADLSELEFAKDGQRVAEIDLLASCDDRVIVGEAKSHPKLGDKSQRRSKAKKLAMVARVLHADEILLCTSTVGNWSNADIDAVQAAVTAQFADAPDQPTIRVVTGLGTGQVIDYRAERTDTATAGSSTDEGHG